MGNVNAVEVLDWDLRIGSNQHIDSAHVQVGSSQHQGLGDRAIAGTNIEHRGDVRQDLGEMVRQDPNPSARHVPLVETLENTHRRRNPSTLRKKLNRMVWNPSEVNVTPGMTHRIVEL